MRILIIAQMLSEIDLTDCRHISSDLDPFGGEQLSGVLAHDHYDEAHFRDPKPWRPRPSLKVKNAGALHPSKLRQVTTPLPRGAATRKRHFRKRGTTTTHFAAAVTSSGIPLGGSGAIRWRTLVASSKHATISFRVEAAAMTPTVRTASNATPRIASTSFTITG
jgi:hypothetical protein